MDAIQWLILQLVGYYQLAVFVAVVLSLLMQFNVINSRNQFVAAVSSFFYSITEPALRPIRRLLPAFGGVDISPWFLLLGLEFLKRLIIGNWPG